MGVVRRLKLIVNDDIHTGPDSIAVVTSYEGSMLHVCQQTETAIGDMSGADNEPAVRILLKLGEIAAKVNHEVDLPADFAIRTSDATASVHGTKFVVAYDPNAGTTVIRVDEGKAEVTPTNKDFKPVEVPAPGSASVSKEGVKVENVAIP
jgi:ferric-dicitrate binding protein FerR (iron transport regulator)